MARPATATRSSAKGASLSAITREVRDIARQIAGSATELTDVLRKADSVSRNLSHTSEQLADEGAETLAEHTAEALSVFRHSAGTLGAAITTLSDNAGDVSKTLTDTCAGLTRVEQARRQALEIGNALAVMTSSGRHQTPSPAVRDAILQFMVSRYTMAAERAVHNRCTGSQLEVKEAEGAAFPQEEEDHDLDAILF